MTDSVDHIQLSTEIRADVFFDLSALIRKAREIARTVIAAVHRGNDKIIFVREAFHLFVNDMPVVQHTVHQQQLRGIEFPVSLKQHCDLSFR